LNVSRRAFLSGAAAAPLTSGCSLFPKGMARDLAWIDATETAALIRRREISAAEAVEAAIGRAEALNPKLNFMVAKDFDRARAAAAGALPSGPFVGVPILIKDLHDVAGLQTRYGSRASARAPAVQSDDATVASVRAAGFIAFGKSSTPEYGFLPTTEPLAFGPTPNPWDLSRSGGGSSGGAAVATAAGVIPVGQASDGGGSIRIPASCCGLFGLKPSRGRVVGDRTSPTDISVRLCVSRSVRDTAAYLAAVERTGEGALPRVGLVAGPTKRKLRIAWTTTDPLGRRADPDVAAGVNETVKTLLELGHEVRAVEAWPMDASTFTEDFLNLWAEGGAQVVARLSQFMPPAAVERGLEPFTLALARRRASLSADAFERSVGRLIAGSQAYLRWFREVDVVLSPVLSTAPPKLGQFSGDVPAETLVERLTDYVGYTPLNNVAGNPAMSVPLVWNAEGLPIGMHFAADVGQEAMLLSLAYQLERARPWKDRRPPVRA